MAKAKTTTAGRRGRELSKQFQRSLKRRSGTCVLLKAPARQSVFNAVARRTVFSLHELRAKLGTEGKTPDQIDEGVQAAFTKGELPKM